MEGSHMFIRFKLPLKICHFMWKDRKSNVVPLAVYRPIHAMPVIFI